MKNERFINWMRLSPFSTFRKTWGVINEDLNPGDYYITIENNWNNDIF